MLHQYINKNKNDVRRISRKEALITYCIGFQNIPNELGSSYT